MQLYIYAKSGHGYGLDRVKRACAIYEQLKQFDPILCTTDFRAGTFAKDVFGVKKSVSVDLIENLPNLMERGDNLIFDSDEPSEFMKEHMKDFCTELFEIGKDIPNAIVHSDFQNSNAKEDTLFFFGDDDYHEEFINLLNADNECINMTVLLGHYYFLGNEEKISSKFKITLEDSEYTDAIKSHKFTICGSVQTAIECLACDNKPVFFARKDKTADNEIDFETLNHFGIPIIDFDNMKDLIDKFLKIKNNYPQTNNYEKFDFSHIIDRLNVSYLQLPNY